MSDWWTYRISDFLLFSRETYVRLFELYNADVWPLHLVAIAAGIAILVLALRRRGGRAIAAILAIEWLWVAWAFLIRRYATINFAATWFAAAFVVEAILLVWIGVVRNRFQPSTLRFGLALFVFALIAYPFVTSGRMEVFALAPDPTVLATLGVILFAGDRLRASLLVVPLLWCAISGATLWSMQMPDALLLPTAAVVTLVLSVWRRVRSRSSVVGSRCSRSQPVA